MPSLTTIARWFGSAYVVSGPHVLSPALYDPSLALSRREHKRWVKLALSRCSLALYEHTRQPQAPSPFGSGVREAKVVSGFWNRPHPRPLPGERGQ